VKQGIIYISILMTAALCIGIYLISTTAVITRDGVVFIEYAKDLEVEPDQTMLQEYQHPGYPVMILFIHKAIRLFNKGESIFSWIYPAQSIALVFRLLTIIVLYFIGRNLVVRRMPYGRGRLSFWAILILIFLPKPAHYGSDALSDWPHLFFLATGMLLLIRASTNRRWWLFGFAGLTAGVGYLIRPECAQVIVYGSLWLGLQLLGAKRTLDRPKTVLALALLVGGFLIAAGPYMRLKGAVFPKKHVGEFAVNTQTSQFVFSQRQIVSNTAGIIPSDIAGAFKQLIENIGETLMWFFVPALLIGMHKWLKKRKWNEPETFFVTALIVLNVPVMIWLYFKHGYMDVRHTLPLVVFTIFFIPTGLDILARWLGEKCLKKNNVRFGFAILTTIGIAICIPKLLRPLHYDKLIFRKAAQWLSENTLPSDLIATPDLRISFYSEREGVYYKKQVPAKNVQYIVRVSKKKSLSDNQNLPKVVDILYADKSDRYKIDIYKPFN
jgi:hypothetical protein